MYGAWHLMLAVQDDDFIMMENSRTRVIFPQNHSLFLIFHFNHQQLISYWMILQHHYFDFMHIFICFWEQMCGTSLIWLTTADLKHFHSQVGALFTIVSVSSHNWWKETRRRHFDIGRWCHRSYFNYTPIDLVKTTFIVSINSKNGPVLWMAL